MAVKFFTDLYQPQETNVPKFNWGNIGLVGLTQEQISWINRSIKNEEIQRVVFQLCPNYVPRLDGFIAKFYQHFWSIVGIDVISFI